MREPRPVLDQPAWLNDSPAERLRRALERDIILVIRVSSLRQAEESEGGIKHQRQQVFHLYQHQIPPERIEVLDLLGESGRVDAHRPRFRALVKRAESGSVGVVIFAYGDRISRNDYDAQQLFDALAAYGGLVVLNGMPFDPADPHQRAMLSMTTVLAEVDNEGRRARLCDARLAKAQGGTMYRALVSGMVWGSPEDPRFVKAMRRAGLREWLQSDRLERYSVGYRKDGRMYYPFPFPDSEVYESVGLRLAWLEETRSVQSVVERMETDALWPRPGYYPVVPHGVFNPEQGVVWEPIRRHLRSTQVCRAALYRFYRKPELFGIYEITVTRKPARPPYAEAVKESIQVEGAFPSFRPPADRPLFDAIIEGAPYGQLKYTGARNHFLERVKCAILLPGGTPCGYRLTPFYQRRIDGFRSYGNTWCCARHRWGAQIPRDVLEDTVLQVVRSVFSRQVLEALAGTVRREQHGRSEERRRLERRAAELGTKIDRARRFQLEADDEDDVRYWRGESQSLREQRTALEKRLDILEREEADVQSMHDEELEGILRIGFDLDQVLESATQVVGKVRQVLAELVECVYVRTVAEHVYLVEVEFPSGERIVSEVMACGIHSTQPIRLLAHERLASLLEDWIERPSQEVERSVLELAGDLVPDFNRATSHLREFAPWTPDRVLAAAFEHRHRTKRQAQRRGVHETVSALAHRVGELESVVLERVLRGELGPAKMIDGQLAIAAERHELHRRFREFARREVASQRGWDLRDTLTPQEFVALPENPGAQVSAVIRQGRKTGSAAADAVGWYFIHRSRHPLSRGYLVHALARHPELAALSLEDWVPLHEAVRRFPELTPKAVRRNAPALVLDAGCAGPRTTFVWVGPEVADTLMNPEFRAGVAALGNPDITPDQFISVSELSRRFRRFHQLTRVRVERAITAGILIVVDVITRNCHPKPLVWVPDPVRRVSRWEDLQAWLEGRFPP